MDNATTPLTADELAASLAHAALTPMEQVIEAALEVADKAAKEKDPETTEVACFEAQVIFGDGSMFAGAVKRGPLPRTYVIAGPFEVPDGRGGARRVEDKLLEMCFHGSDVKRVMTLRDQVKLIRGLGIIRP